MLSALAILVLLIFATPTTVIFDGSITSGLLAAVAAILLALTALRICPREAGFLFKTFGPAALAAAIPAIWMLVQALPLGVSGLVHPIWKTAEASLGLRLPGSISIDPGATLISFVRYLSAIAIAFVATSVAIDRRRAEWVFFALTVASTLIGLMILVANLFGFTFPQSGIPGQANIAAVDCAGLGVIFATAAVLRTSERDKRRPPNQDSLWVWSTPSVWLVALAICALAVIVGGRGPTYVAIMCGVAAVVVTAIIRQFRIGPWGVAGIASIAMFVAIAAAAFQPGIRAADLTVAFATHADRPLVEVTQRLLAEGRWTGTGAGTFGAVLPIYGDVDELTTGYAAPTAAAAIAVELGRPFLWVILAMALALALALLRGSLSRHRDSFYSAAGAGCVVTLMLLSFDNVALLSTPVTVIGAAAIGTAIAQSKRRSI